MSRCRRRAPSRKSRSSALVLTIDREQNVFLGDKPVNLANLPSLLRQPNTDPAHQIIYLRADERVPFGAFASVMDAVKQAGITNISIVTQPLQKTASSRPWHGFRATTDSFDQPERLGAPFAKSMSAPADSPPRSAMPTCTIFSMAVSGARTAPRQGAIQATLVSSAALPLPQDHPPTDNVLATETPSVAPASRGAEAGADPFTGGGADS